MSMYSGLVASSSIGQRTQESCKLYYLMAQQHEEILRCGTGDVKLSIGEGDLHRLPVEKLLSTIERPVF
jgi:hypothetical protein